MAARTLEEIVDVDRYMRGDRRAQTVAAARRALTETGSVTLEGFVLPDALADMLDESKAARPLAHRRDAAYTAYLADEATGDESHPTRRKNRYAMHAVASDAWDPERPLSILYREPQFVAFVAEMLDEPQLYPLDDPLLALTTTYLGDGDEHGWHFDANDFVVSLLLQRAQRGGTFEFAPFIRSADAPNFDAVERTMNGDASLLNRIDAAPGTLALFAGKRSLHRVSPVGGETERIIALLSYDREPHVVHEPAIHMRVFGRTLTTA